MAVKVALESLVTFLLIPQKRFLIVHKDRS